MKRIYFEMDHLSLMADWLRTRPEGAFHILIGGAQEQTAVDDILARLDSPARRTLAALMASGPVKIKAMMTRAAELPQGVVFEDGGDE